MNGAIQKIGQRNHAHVIGRKLQQVIVIAKDRPNEANFFAINLSIAGHDVPHGDGQDQRGGELDAREDRLTRVIGGQVFASGGGCRAHTLP